jgi:hypothetical protein
MEREERERERFYPKGFPFSGEFAFIESGNCANVGFFFVRYHEIRSESSRCLRVAHLSVWLSALKKI